MDVPILVSDHASYIEWNDVRKANKKILCVYIHEVSCAWDDLAMPIMSYNPNLSGYE